MKSKILILFRSWVSQPSFFLFLALEKTRIKPCLWSLEQESWIFFLLFNLINETRGKNKLVEISQEYWKLFLEILFSYSIYRLMLTLSFGYCTESLNQVKLRLKNLCSFHLVFSPQDTLIWIQFSGKPEIKEN